MKRLFFILSGLLVLIMLCSSVIYAQEPVPRDWITGEEHDPQVKVVQVPLPFQFWAIDPSGMVIDRIRISPTWLVPPDGLPPGTGPIFVRRQVATITPNVMPTIPLEELLWGDSADPNKPTPGPMPGKPIQWTPVDTSWREVVLGQDLEVEIPPPVGTTQDKWAVLVAYEVAVPVTDPGGAPAMEITGRFINEAEVSFMPPPAPIPAPPGVPPWIIRVMCNFDIHNNTHIPGINNFELDFDNLVFGPDDVVWAIGGIKAWGLPPMPVPWVPWGANPGSPLVVQPINQGKGTEVKWIQQDKPLKWCDWVHFGLVFNLPGIWGGVNPAGVNTTVQGYWTISKPVPPIPELPAIMLLGTGIVAIGAFILYRRKLASKTV